MGEECGCDGGEEGQGDGGDARADTGVEEQRTREVVEEVP